MTESNNQTNTGAAPEDPSVQQTSTTDTPPIASTPADDGSNFYNTPLVAGTPVQPEQKTEVSADVQTAETPVSSDPQPQIPGLSLVNDSLPTNPTGQAGSGTNEVSSKTDPDAMDVEHEQNQPQDTEVSGTNGAEQTTAEAAVPAQEGEQDENEEEHPEWELDSSPYESSSDSSDSDSSDDSDEDEDYPILSPEEQARILMQGEMGSDDEGEGKGKMGTPLKTANEIQEDAPPIPDITVTPEMKIVLLGHVEAAVENTVLIAANVTGEYQVLEAGSLLCLEDRRVAGVVSETLGRVENPLYAVRLPTAADVEERGLSRGAIVYYVVDHSTFVFTQPLKGLKGSDASNFHDEEVAEDEVEFSDDEQEAEYRRKLKQKRQERKGAKNQDGGSKPGRGPPGPSKLGQSELNYDDNVPEDGYTPLARPKNLHEMMRQEAPVESDRHSGFGGGRGRGRGSDRGRGGRGRGRGGRDHGHHHSHHDRQSYNQHQDRPDAQPHHQPQQPQQYPPFNPAQQYPTYPQQPQPQQPYAAQGAMPATPFNFQMPFQQAYQQPNPYQQMSPTPHINPLFLAALQQQQQFQQQQQQQQPQPQQPAAAQPQAQNQAMNFDQVKAQLDLLRQLSGNQWPPRS
ncbi:Gar1/Naf1 RNA binding region-domain-containing protein [Aspergillus unguis]